MSNRIRTAGSVAWLNMRKWGKKPEIYMTILCLFIFIHTKTQPLHMMLQEFKIGATPFLFPFLFADQYMAFFIMLGCVILFSNAPFLESGYVPALMRTGREKWALGQILYIIGTSFCYLLVILLISILLLLPYISLENQWGSIWQTLAQTDAAYQIQLDLNVPYRILMDYQPVQAVMTQFFMAMLVCVFLGLLLFVLNFTLGKGPGICIAAFHVLIVTRVGSMDSFLYWLTPVYWVNLEEVAKQRISQGPTLLQAAVILLLLNIVLSLLAVRAMKTKDLK